MSVARIKFFGYENGSSEIHLATIWFDVTNINSIKINDSGLGNLTFYGASSDSDESGSSLVTTGKCCDVSEYDYVRVTFGRNTSAGYHNVTYIYNGFSGE